MINLSKYIKKPVTKDGENLENSHYRTLYRRTAVEDNYTDPDYLASMKVNTNLKYYTFEEGIEATVRVSLNITACILYFIMYHHLGRDNITPARVLRISLWCSLLGYLLLQVWRFWNESWNLETLKKIPILSDCLVVISCGSFSYLFVPILRTITITMDLDSVHAVCAAMFGVHLFCNNYGIMAFCVSRPLSMNSAIFSMICLASRLQSDDHCLALLSFGVLSFICFPPFSQMLWNWTPGSIIFIMIGTIASYSVSSWLALFFISLMFIVVVLSPSLYVYYVQHKQNILGPWDEAKPDLTFAHEQLGRDQRNRKNKTSRRTTSADSRHQD